MALDRIPAYQLDAAGMFRDVVPALASPMEPGAGVYLTPRGATRRAMPGDWVSITAEDGGTYAWSALWPAGQWPRFNGHAWELVNAPTIAIEPTPAEKLAAFLAANPDVAALVSDTTPQEQ